MTRLPYTPDQDARRKLRGNSTRELHRLGFIEKDGHWYRFPDDGSLRALHDSASEESFRFEDDDGGWRLWKRFRRMCCARDIPPPEWVAHRVVREEGRELMKATVTRKLGVDAANLCWPRIAELAGVECVTVPERRSGTYEQFVDLIPDAVRDVVSAAIEHEIDKENPRPRETLIGKILGLQGTPCRVLGALTVAACVYRRTTVHRRTEYMVAIGRTDRLLGPRQDCSEHNTHRWEALLAGDALTGEKRLARLETYGLVRGARSIVMGMIDELIPEHREAILAMFPADHRDAWAFRGRCQKMAVGQRQKGKAPIQDHRIELVPRYIEILAASRNRTAEASAILGDLYGAMGNAREELAQGRRAGFTSKVPLLSQDGLLTDREAALEFEIVPEGTIWNALHEAEPDRAIYHGRLAPPEGEKPGAHHDAANWGRLHVVFRGDRSGNGYEPFWLDIYRLNAFDRDPFDDARAVEQRRVFLKRHGIVDKSRAICGLIQREKSARSIATHALKLDMVLVPLEALYHGLLFAHLVVTYGVRFGARLGEIMQLRLEADCFSKVYHAGAWRPAIFLKHKGMDRNAPFGTNAEIRALVLACRKLGNARWYPGLLSDRGAPDIPSVPYGHSDRTDLPEARYVLAAQGSAADHELLNLLVRVLLIDVVDTTSHTGRYIFASVLGQQGVGYEQIGHLLHHSPRSRMPENYDLSGAVAAEAALYASDLRTEADLVGVSL